MKLFIDTANVDQIREANELGVICGVTTNPSLIAKEGRDFVEVVKEITTIVDGPISAEVISLEHEGMVKEARELIENGNIGGGMLPKLNNCIDAIENGVSRVHILDGRIAHCLLLEIFTNKGIGTAILGEGEENYYDGK